ncbi:phosphodiester glycosidase family protein [Nocardioides plantarum]|uniref:Phosphodiester glycosidase family protein n=1 Tax=Nocardioides plantarum TaxID=29299 RepID=A0ABV5K9E7_9ACTN|nr:phosphodiester glycosidase family protein [Nocardioides plantarum]
MRPLPSVVLAGLLTLTAPLVGSTASADPASPVAPVDPHEAQTSDGVVGPIAAKVSARQRQDRTDSNIKRVNVVPGVDIVQWDQSSSRGPNELSLMTVKWQTPGLSVDYANPGSVAATAPVATMLKADAAAGAVAGVNGDFFDISGSGAPRGVGRDLDRGLLNGRVSGWNGAFSFTSSGWPAIGLVSTRTRVRNYPRLKVSSLNGPVVDPDHVGAYTPAWGRASGTEWTGGQRKGVRYLQVYRHRVVRNSYRLPRGNAFHGTLLVGRGKGARALAKIKVGTRTDVLSGAEGDPRMAIGGNKFLLRHGILQPLDDAQMHPRTAIGIDRDTKTLLLLVVDGRRSDSRGYTMAELADEMADLGADDALNLDGGGSSQLVAKRGKVLKVMNSPSDGHARPVANAIEIRYRKPR